MNKPKERIDNNGESETRILFFMEFSPGTPDEEFRLICENFKPSEAVRAFSERLVCGVCENKEYIDGLISRSSKNWRLERMSRVDRSILRLGVFEMLYMEDIPPKVSIDEAVELGKKFGTEDSGAFINGVLDNVFNKQKLEDPVSHEKQ